MLLVFQSMDAAGKDKTIRHVMSGVNPQGCQVYSIRQVPEAGPASSGQDGSDIQRPEIIGIGIAGVRIIPCDGIVLL